jgi:hypothetical protein
MKFSLGIVLLFLSVTCCAQQAIKVNSNFFLTQKPVFAAGYEFSSDSSDFSFSLNADFGKFQAQDKQFLSSYIEGASTTGFGIMPEARVYLGSATHTGPFGLFATSFVQIRRYSSSEQEGVSVSVEGFNLDAPQVKRTITQAFRYGLGAGYRSGCHASLLHLEILGGYYFVGHGTAWTSMGNEFPGPGDYNFRVELNLVAVF